MGSGRLDRGRRPGLDEPETGGRPSRKERDGDVVLRACVERETVDLVRRLLEAARRFESREKALGFEDVGDAVGREEDDVAGAELQVAPHVRVDLLLLAEAPRQGVGERIAGVVLGGDRVGAEGPPLLGEGGVVHRELPDAQAGDDEDLAVADVRHDEAVVGEDHRERERRAHPLLLGRRLPALVNLAVDLGDPLANFGLDRRRRESLSVGARGERLDLRLEDLDGEARSDLSGIVAAHSVAEDGIRPQSGGLRKNRENRSVLVRLPAALLGKTAGEVPRRVRARFGAQLCPSALAVRHDDIADLDAVVVHETP